MKSQFLKIAGVKSEKAFYKKYPTEAEFFKAHPEAKKMANGGEQDKGQIKKLQQLTDFGNPPIAQFGKSTPFDPNFKVGKLNTTSPTSLGGDRGTVFGRQPTEFGQYTAGMGQSNNGLFLSIADILKNTSNVGQQKGAVQPVNQTVPTTNTTTTINILGGYQSTKMKAPKETFLKKNVLNKAGAIGKSVGKIIDVLDQQKQAKKIAKQDKAVTDLYRQSALSSPVDIEKREYVRPEDVIIQPEQMFPSYGVGTNVLAQDGAMIGGNPTEIMNTFAPNTIYTDMGYEPLNDSDRLKAYYHGGKMSKAQDGGMFSDIGDFFKGGEDSKFAEFMNQGGGEALTNLTSQVGSGGYGPTGGNVIGGEVGSLAGSLLPIPGGKFIGKALGSTIGGLFDKSGKQIMANRQATNQNISDITYSKAGVGLQNQYGSFMEDGGYVSHDWTPQVIATFGEHKLKDLLQPPNDADMLRAGGHLRSYTPPSERAMYTGREQFAMGGDLKVYRGEAETMSYNPYLPDGGETIMFRGPSHENGGMPIEYGSSPVEVEGGEPAVKLQDGGTGEDNMVVFGNLQIPNQFLSEIEDPKAKGKKFKNYVADLSKIEARQNKIIDKSSNTLDNLEVNTPFDKLELDTMNANLIGANMKLKEIAEKKQNAAAVQSAINDTAEEYNVVADDLARGKIKMDKSKSGKAKYGAAIEQAQTGTQKAPITRAVNADDYFYLQGLYDAAKKAKKGPAVKKFQEEYSRINPGFAEQVLGEYPTTNYGKAKSLKATDLASNYDSIFGPRTERYMSALTLDRVKTPPLQVNPPIITTLNKPFPKGITPTTTTEETTKGKFPWMSLANQAIDYLRPSDAEGLDPNQLQGEFYALTNNQLEPVQAQRYNPQLFNPYDISLQDQLNANQSTYNANLRLASGNPEALALLAAQKYAADRGVLGEQFRANQANKAGVYNQNIQTMNDAQLKNLNILDQQYVRQAQAKSNTKATTQGALNSISSKIAQNKLDNRTLATYENLYNYRYDPRFRAQNMNPLVDFDSMIANASSMTPEELKAYAILKEEQAKKSAKQSETKKRNGSIVKALKNL
jgi:hypothetical protein